MKRWTASLVGVLVLAGLAFLAWHYFFPSPEQIIKGRLQEIAKKMSFNPNESPLAKLANTQKLGAFFTEDVEVNIDVRGHSAQTINGREELLQAALGGRSMVSSMTVELVDITITLGASKQTAVVTLTARGNVAGDSNGLIQELKLNMIKQDSGWLIKRVETVRTLL